MTFARRLWRYGRIGLCVGAALVLAAVGACVTLIFLSLPQTEGEVRLSGLDAAVTVLRDANGVPKIEAGSTLDALFGLGFVHAQDRLFQMDLRRRAAAGRLSELFGSKMEASDRLMRRLSLYRVAEENLRSLAPQSRLALDAYVAGINAYLRNQGNWLPLEFMALRYAPEPWRPADVVALTKLLSLQLSGNYRRELLRTRLSKRLSPEQLDELFRSEPADSQPRASRLYLQTPSIRLADYDVPLDGSTDASNAWVLDGRRTVSGKPILANDPHLDFSTPGTWYLASLHAPALDLAGGTMPGTFFFLGHNANIAWGISNTFADVEDLFVEHINPGNTDEYLTPEGWRSFESRSEIINVRGRKAVELIVRSTRHGPVIVERGSDGSAAGDGDVLALAATFLGAEDHTVDAVLALYGAHDWKSFSDALRSWSAPVLNFAYADTDGHIGLRTVGEIPVRRAGDGKAPVEGWNALHDWSGTVPYEAMPQVLDPPGGYIITANNRMVQNDYPFLITNDWELPFRAQRIEELVVSMPRQSLVETSKIMDDVVSTTARLLLPTIKQAPVQTALGKRAQDMMAAWDGAMRRDIPQPTIFMAWYREFSAIVLGELSRNYGAVNPYFVLGALREKSVWCHNGPSDCRRMTGEALDRAAAALHDRLGEDVGRWQWGGLHHAAFDHPLFGKWLGFRLPADGGNDTINAGSSRMDSLELSFLDVHGPGLRAIYDLSDLDASQFLLAPGQSGQFLSSHYGDLLLGWQNFDWIRIDGSEQQKARILRLLPELARGPR